MPSVVTHYYFSDCVRKLAPVEIQNLINDNISAYHWGAQGPDLLYYHNAPFGSRIALLGRKMHSSFVAETFYALVKSAKRLNNDTAISYLMGFCTHYKLDRRLHPYVDAIINTRLKESYPNLDENSRHRLCESDLDASVIDYYLHKNPAKYEAFKLLAMPPQKVINAISQMLSDVSEAVYHIDVSSSKIESAMSSMQLTHTIIHGGGHELARLQVNAFENIFNCHGLLSSMLRPKKSLPEDCANLSHTAWSRFDLPNIERHESFFELFDASISYASNLQKTVFDCCKNNADLNPLLFSSNYSGVNES